MLKVELHAHTADDPVDRIDYDATTLIDRAAALGYDAVAVTLHERQYDIAGLQPYARERGIVLIPGVERTIEGNHVLLLHFPAHATQIDTFAELARLRARYRGLVVAPHPFFPAASCLRRRLDDHPELFDAIEWNAMYTRSVNFNAAAAHWAARRGVPLVGNGDVHLLRQLGPTYSLVDAEPDPESICQAIARGRVRIHTEPLRWSDVISILGKMGSAQFHNKRVVAAWRDPARAGHA